MKGENVFINLFFILLSIFLVFYVLFIGSSLIIPFIIAILFSFAIIGLSDFFKKFKIPSIISMFLSLATYVFIFWLIGKMINSNIQDVVELLPVYQDKLGSLYISSLEYFKIPPTVDAYTLFQKVDLTNIFSSVITSVTGIFSSAGIIFFYVMFILLEYRYFSRKILLIFNKKAGNYEMIDTISKIKKDVKSYFLIKTIVSFLTGFLSYLVMLAFGLDFALFWAMIIFLLNFIPNVGSVISTSFPIFLSLIQYDSLYPFFFISSTLIGIQILMGNIIEPKFMGNKLNLSPLVIIISLGFWGSLWGIVGMILSVPIMVIINIVLSKFETTKPIAILLSEKGELDVNDDKEVDENIKSVKEKLKLLK